MKNMIRGGADVDLPTLNGGETSLILATERGLYHCTKALLEAGANGVKVRRNTDGSRLVVHMLEIPVF